MRHRMIVALVLALALGLGLASTSSAVAAPVSLKKAIWGPVFRDGVSQFPIYRDLGAGIYETNLKWAEIAPQRPAHPTNPNDPPTSGLPTWTPPCARPRNITCASRSSSSSLRRGLTAAAERTMPRYT